MISPKARAFLFAKKADEAKGIAPQPQKPYSALTEKLNGIAPSVPAVQVEKPIGMKKKRFF